MEAPHDADPLPPALLGRVRARLGLPADLRPDLEGLRAFYRAWCERVPFDNVRKMTAIARRDPGPLPGSTAEEFFTHWLTDGDGGTCWSSANALHALAAALGFDAVRIAGSMRDLGIVTHASTKVRIGGQAWLVDSSMLTDEPLPLGPGVTIRQGAVIPAEIEAVDGTHLLWFFAPPNPGLLPCRLLVDPADAAFYQSSHEGTREKSAFNQRLFARCNRGGEGWTLSGTTLFHQTAAGLATRAVQPAEIAGILTGTFGHAPRLVAEWIEAGGLALTLQPPSGAKPPPPLPPPPSARPRT